MKKIFKIFIALIVIATIALGGAYLWYQNGITSPNSDTTTSKEFTIAMGSSIDKIGGDLLSAGLIQDKTLFYIYSKLNPEKANAIQAGNFLIPQNSSIEQIYVILKTAMNAEDIKVTIIEGLRYDEVINAVSKAFEASTYFSKTEMTSIVENPDNYSFSTQIQQYLDTYKPAGKNLEGFLFPDTYYFAKTATAKDIIERQIATLFTKLSAADLNIAKNSNYTLYEYLTVASLLEKEANVKKIDDEYMIADVIYKRLERGVEGTGVKLLQLDCTLAYPLKDWSYFDTHNFDEGKLVDTPYNTFIHTGLTPTPINNPGMNTIHAAINPIRNDYYYYIYDEQGQVYFGKTLADHERNVRLYL